MRYDVVCTERQYDQAPSPTRPTDLPQPETTFGFPVYCLDRQGRIPGPVQWIPYIFGNCRGHLGVSICVKPACCDTN